MPDPNEDRPAPPTARPDQSQPGGDTGSLDPFEGVPGPLAGALRKRGFETLTSVQRAVLTAEFEGRDLRISSQTGSGKTVAIGLVLARPLLAPAAPSRKGPNVLILVPTRELAMQVRDELRWLFADVPALGIEVVMGGTSVGVERRALSRNPRVVVGTPGRVLDHLKSRGFVGGDVGHVVLDESDRMLDMGFREELEAILEEMPTERRTHLVSATFPDAVRKLADRFQDRAVHVEGTKLGVANADIEHVAHLVDSRGTYAAIVNYLLLNEGQRSLVFVERRVDVAALTEKLTADGFPVQAFSGELPQAQRTRTLNAFRDGTIKTLVSTDVAARGIDVPDIELVIHAEPPESADTYVHRSGRTGRAGSTGRSVLLVTPKARHYVTRVVGSAGIELDWRPAPTAARVRKQLLKRFRQKLHGRLAEAEAPSQKQIDYAKQLLDGRDAADLVARLLELAQPEPTRAPMDVPEPTADEARGRASREYVTFAINWGKRSGAAPNRLLSHVCRRGGIRGELIGSIKVGPLESTFDVQASVADSFEKRAQRPDPREPKIRIVRMRGPAQAARPTGKGPKHRPPFKKKKSPPRGERKRRST